MHRAAKTLAILGMALAFAGCGFKDLDKRFFVIAVGIDEGKTAPYKVSLKLAIPSPKTEPGEAKFQVITQEAETIAEAVRLAKSKVDKEFDFGHAQLIVIGKAFSDDHELGHSLDWFFRRRDIQMISYMGIGVPDAEAVIKTKPLSERLPGNGLILPFSKEGTESPYLVPVHLFDYYRMWKYKGKDPFLPVIKSEPETFIIENVVILKGTKKKLELSPDETSIFNQLARSYPRFAMKAQVQNKWVTFTGTRLKVSYKILTPAGGTPEVRFRVSAEVESEDAQRPLFDLSWTQLERLVAAEMKDQMLALLRKFQQNGVDPIGLGLHYRATRHQGDAEYGKWQEIYPEVRFSMHVQVRFKGTGVIK
ncbi:Ger(x)C family spore germination protein [Cohnella caldifontis]|uniref:Ger(x)C family spore germination protein n=1 Tax=Cohnella caldifontis TaxID=3027471 RepID=UPI0023EB76BE|nr:Ger(x)C family spore germination protein [Cohnella sp. YIM B05605]